MQKTAFEYEKMLPYPYPDSCPCPQPCYNHMFYPCLPVPVFQKNILSPHQTNAIVALCIWQLVCYFQHRSSQYPIFRYWRQQSLDKKQQQIFRGNNITSTPAGTNILASKFRQKCIGLTNGNNRFPLKTIYRAHQLVQICWPQSSDKNIFPP